jgi:hypothetical protein
MVTNLTWRQVVILAFGDWATVARIVGGRTGGQCSRWNDMPARTAHQLLAAPEAPGWLTYEMLVWGARLDIAEIVACDPGPAVPDAVAAE